jgi:hypothetical protein
MCPFVYYVIEFIAFNLKVEVKTNNIFYKDEIMVANKMLISFIHSPS